MFNISLFIWLKIDFKIKNQNKSFTRKLKLFDHHYFFSLEEMSLEWEKRGVWRETREQGKRERVGRRDYR